MPYDYDIFRKLFLNFVTSTESGPIPAADKFTLSPPSGFPLTEETHRHVARLITIGLLQLTRDIHEKHRGPVPTLRLTSEGSVWVWRALSDEAWPRSLPDLHVLVEGANYDEDV